MHRNKKHLYSITSSAAASSSGYRHQYAADGRRDDERPSADCGA